MSHLAADRNSVAGWVGEEVEERSVCSGEKSVVLKWAHSELLSRLRGFPGRVLLLAVDCPCHMYVE